MLPNFLIKSLFLNNFFLEIQDTYYTIANSSPEVLFKEKNSKFFGYAFPITSEEEVKIRRRAR